MNYSSLEQIVSWHIDCLQLPYFRERGLTGKGVRIGLLDSGLAVNSQTLVGKIQNTTTISYSGFSATADWPTDSSGHGTFNANLICGSEKGIAPDSSLYVAKVVDGGNTVARILHGLDWLLQFDLHLMNIPLGVSGFTPIFQPAIDEIRRRGILPIVAVGNGGAGRSRSPGCYREVFSIGSFDMTCRPSKFSGSFHSYGKTICLKPDLLAPGEDVFSLGLHHRFEKRSGTSMASSIVTGVTALLCQGFPTVPSLIIENLLKESCISPPPTFGHRVAKGLISPIHTYGCLEDLKRRGDYVYAYQSPNRPSEKYIDDFLMERCDYVAENQVIEAIFAYDKKLTREAFQEKLKKLGFDHNITRIKIFNRFRMALIQAPPAAIKELVALPIITMASDAGCSQNHADVFHFK